MFIHCKLYISFTNDERFKFEDGKPFERDNGGVMEYCRNGNCVGMEYYKYESGVCME